MTPDEIEEASQLLKSHRALVQIGAELLAKPSFWGSIMVGKLDTEENTVSGNDAMVSAAAAKVAIDAARTFIATRLRELGVSTFQPS